MMPSHLDGVLSISKIASAFDGSAHAAIVVPRRPVVFRRGGCARRVVVPAFALSQRHVTVAEFAAFLTAAGSSADAEEYLWYNPFNPMLPLRWTGSSWAYRQERAREPMTGVSVLGALAYAHAVSGTLPTVAQWLAGLAGETSLSEAGSRPRGNVAEIVGRVTPVNAFPISQQGFFDLIGNVGMWCRWDDREPSELACRTQSFPVAGCAWNKSPNDVDDSWLYERWGRTGSVSVGFRCAWPVTAS